MVSFRTSSLLLFQKLSSGMALNRTETSHCTSNLNRENAEVFLVFMPGGGYRHGTRHDLGGTHPAGESATRAVMHETAEVSRSRWWQLKVIVFVIVVCAPLLAYWLVNVWKLLRSRSIGRHYKPWAGPWNWTVCCACG